MHRVRLGLAAPAGDWASASVTIGNFDGVHRGHQTLVAAAVASSRGASDTTVVLTFDPHPSRILARGEAAAALTTAAQKEELLAELGVEVLAVLPFTEAVAALTPAEFVSRVLSKALRARHVVVGERFRFGHAQAGDVSSLRALGQAHGFTVEAVAPVLEAGAPISSSRIREALARGEAAAAASLLGRPYFIDARVVPGEGRGRTIGVPTANLAPENEVLPATGVYAARARLADGSRHLAVANVGRRPTFDGVGIRVEAHLLDFRGDLYGSPLRLAFESRLRAEMRFPNAAALVARIGEDIAEARAILSKGREERV